MNLPRFKNAPGGQTRASQRGVVMWVALVVLIVMTLAGLAMLRQMGSGLSIAGNLAFKQSAIAAADLGTERFRAWVTSAAALPLLDNDSIANGYLSTWGTSVDPKTFNWNGQSLLVMASNAANSQGNEVRYIAHRLCQTAGLPPTDPAQKCSDLVENKDGGNKGGLDYSGGPPLVSPPQPFFRVTTRVTGPRNTVTYTQVILH
jgi:type IV pilus assembly protein PilX